MGEILDIELAPDDPNFGKLLQTQISVCQTVMSTSVKADENALRKRAIDTLPKLLERINAEQARLPKHVHPVIEGAFEVITG
jgi:hypothetical protein